MSEDTVSVVLVKAYITVIFSFLPPENVSALALYVQQEYTPESVSALALRVQQEHPEGIA